MSSLPSSHQAFTVTVDHWRGRRWRFVRHVDLSYEDARELVDVYRALGYAKERIHITLSSPTTDVAAA